MTTPEEKIQEILKKCETKNYIFRGENADYRKISSGLYRQYCEGDGKKLADDDDPLIDNEYFFVSSVEKDIVEKARQHIRPGAPNIEILTELQHYGGKTALLDFSKNIYIALFFACDGHFGKNGRVIFFETSEPTKSTDIDYDQIEKEIEKEKDEAKHTLISPTGKSPRVIFQSSIFVHVPKGYLEVSKDDIIEIKNELKKPLLDYLSKYFDINTETIYNDIQGFIRNQHNHSTAEIEFYRGNANYALGEHEKAIINYTRAIDLNPQYAEAYNNRGVANAALGKYEEAIKDYTKAIKLDSQDAEAYNNRGFANVALKKYTEAITDFNKAIEFDSQDAKFYSNRGLLNSVLKNYEEAIKDYTEAIELDPQYVEAYNNRGIANRALGKFEEAIEDYDKAIELDPQFSTAYLNRGNANRDLENYEETIKDYIKAKKLFEKEGNTEMVKECEEKIEELQKLIAKADER